MADQDTQTTPREMSRDEARMIAFKGDLKGIVSSFTHLKPEERAAMQNAAMISVARDPKLLTVSPASMFLALRQAADYNIMPDGVEATIHTYNGEAKFIPMVRGIITRVLRSGLVDNLWAEIVYSGERFSIDITGGDRKPTHEFDPLNRGKQQDIVGVYAVAKMANGSIDTEVLTIADVMKIRAVAATKKVWDAWFEEMARKSAIRRLAKRLPVSREDLEFIMSGDEFDLEGGPTVLEQPVSPLQRRILAARAKRAGLIPPPAGQAKGDFVPDAVIAGEDRAWTHDEPLDFDASSQAFLQGQQAWQEKVAVEACPFMRGTDEATDWLAGWHDMKRVG